MLNDFTFSLICLIALNGVWSQSARNSQVHELDDRIIEAINTGKWLITFYAPWCGHCRKLDPVLDEIGEYFSDKSINVVKVDATRFAKASNHFEVRGYPTIKYVHGNNILNFNGERSKQEIIEFIQRADSPRVGKVKHTADFDSLKSRLPLFFLLILSKSEEKNNNQLVKEYYELADRHFLDAYFYVSQSDYLVNTISIDEEIGQFPTVSVVKDGEVVFFEKRDYTSSMEDFIRNEQFQAFTPITLTNFHNLIETRKYLVILLFNSMDETKAILNKRIQGLMKTYSIKNRLSYHKEFQFGYTENQDLLNGIAVWTLSTPIIFILNSTSYEYSIVDVLNTTDDTNDKLPFINTIDIETVLNETRNGSLKVYGGHGFFRTLRRPLWELYRAVIEMFIEAPFISLLIFGFPFGVISIVFYFLCCLDTNDQMEQEEDLSDSELEELEEEEQELLNGDEQEQSNNPTKKKNQ